MDIFFCDQCGTRVTEVDLRGGHGIRRQWDVICGGCLELGHGKEWLARHQPPAARPSGALRIQPGQGSGRLPSAPPGRPAPATAAPGPAGRLDAARDRARTREDGAAAVAAPVLVVDAVDAAESGLVTAVDAEPIALAPAASAAGTAHRHGASADDAEGDDEASASSSAYDLDGLPAESDAAELEEDRPGTRRLVEEPLEEAAAQRSQLSSAVGGFSALASTYDPEHGAAHADDLAMDGPFDGGDDDDARTDDTVATVAPGAGLMGSAAGERAASPDAPTVPAAALAEPVRSEGAGGTGSTVAAKPAAAARARTSSSRTTTPAAAPSSGPATRPGTGAVRRRTGSGKDETEPAERFAPPSAREPGRTGTSAATSSIRPGAKGSGKTTKNKSSRTTARARPRASPAGIYILTACSAVVILVIALLIRQSHVHGRGGGQETETVDIGAAIKNELAETREVVVPAATSTDPAVIQHALDQLDKLSHDLDSFHQEALAKGWTDEQYNVYVGDAYASLNTLHIQLNQQKAKAAFK